MGGDENAILAAIFSGDDSITGSTQADLLAGYAGADTIDGGDGTDRVDYSSSSAGVTVDLVAGTGAGGDAQGDVLTSIENLTGSTFGDKLYGSAGANALDGGAGSDTLRGNGGADALTGGLAIDVADYSNAAGGVVVNLAAGTGSGSDAEGDTLSGIENVYATKQDDTLTGDGNANILWGAEGNDVLNGGDGADTLSAGTGTDQLSGGAGDDLLRGAEDGDTIDGGAGSDTASYYESTAGVQVDLLAGTAAGGTAAGDTLTNVENLTGTQFADTLTGDAAANVLMGMGGQDLLTGGGGADTFRYGSTLGQHPDRGEQGHDHGFQPGRRRQDRPVGDRRRHHHRRQPDLHLRRQRRLLGAGQVRFVSSGANTVVLADTNGDGLANMHIVLTGAITLQASDFVL